MKTFTIKTDPLTNEEYLEVYLRGRQVLTDPFLNKGTAYSPDERLSLGLSGLVRSAVSDIETQRARNYEMFRRKQDDLEKYIFLQSLLNRNEILFYDLLYHHLAEMLPIVYTPTVGKACALFSHITREYRGLYVSPDNIANIDQILRDVAMPEVRLIVAAAASTASSTRNWSSASCSRSSATSRARCCSGRTSRSRRRSCCWSATAIASCRSTTTSRAPVRWHSRR